jgi:low temperature requirement protein LtrA
MESGYLAGNGGANRPVSRHTTGEWAKLPQGHVRELLWLLAIGLDLLSVAVGFYVPDLGRSASREWILSGREVTAYVLAFAGTVSLWWVYFDRRAAHAARTIAASDPWRLTRSAYYWIHPPMIAGIIVAGDADRRDRRSRFC